MEELQSSKHAIWMKDAANKQTWMERGLRGREAISQGCLVSQTSIPSSVEVVIYGSSIPRVCHSMNPERQFRTTDGLRLLWGLCFGFLAGTSGEGRLMKDTWDVKLSQPLEGCLDNARLRAITVSANRD